MRRQKSLRIGVHLANAVVWGPVYRTHLIVARDELLRGVALEREARERERVRLRRGISITAMVFERRDVRDDDAQRVRGFDSDLAAAAAAAAAAASRRRERLVRDAYRQLRHLQRRRVRLEGHERRHRREGGSGRGGVWVGGSSASNNTSTFSTLTIERRVDFKGVSWS